MTLTTSDKEHIIYRIACAVGAGERQFQRRMGASTSEADKTAWYHISDAYLMLLADDRPAVNLPARLIRNPSTTTE
jgi:hypothetical protein